MAFTSTGSVIDKAGHLKITVTDGTTSYTVDAGNQYDLTNLDTFLTAVVNFVQDNASIGPSPEVSALTPLADPATATTADIATKVNAIIAALKA